MAKKNDVNIKITADKKQADSTLDKLTSKLNSFTKANKTLLAPLMKLGTAFTGLSGTIKAGAAIIQGATRAVAELSDAYNVQKNAETTLEVAARNNPYLNGETVAGLKKFASEIQKVSTVGDEQLLPMMAELAASGRSQAEIQDIITASVDASASGLISLESAVQSLNRSYNGELGTLGKLNPQLKNLTAEELKQGGAVKAIKQSFGGLAKETSDNTGAAQKLSNAWGDLKENLGEVVNFFLVPIINFCRKAVESINSVFDAVNQKDNFTKGLTAQEKQIEISNANIEKLLSQRESLENERNERRIKQEEEKAKLLKKANAKSYDDLSQLNKDYWDSHFKDVDSYYETELSKLDAQIQAEQKIIDDALADLNKKAKENANIENLTALNNTALEAQKAYAKTLEDFEKNLKFRRQSGEDISAETEAQERLNTMVSAYIKARTDAGSAMSDSNKWVKNILANIEELSTQISEGKSLSDFLDVSGFKDKKDELIQQIKELDAEYKRLMTTIDFSAIEDGEAKKYEIYEAWALKKEALLNQLNALEEENSERMIDKVADVEQKIVDVVSSIASTMQSVSDLVQQNAENEAKIKIGQLDKFYAAGIISQETYYFKKQKIEKEAAKKQYHLQMAEWTSQIAQATANTALGATKNLASYPQPLGAIMAAATIAAGSIQLATIIANKPTPAYEKGGIVGGSSYSGDKITANVNSGEMILNQRQQRALWESANGNGKNGGGVNLNIRNYAGDVANITPQITSDGIELLIKKTVNQGLENGDFNSALMVAQTSQDGIRYTS